MTSIRHVLAAAALMATSGLCAAAPAHYYVGDNGNANNTGPGTRLQPWGNLQKAIWALNAGDTLTVLDEYPIASTLWITVKGAPGTPITIDSDSVASPRPRLVCEMAPTSTCISVNYTSHLTLNGLTVEPRNPPPGPNKTAAQLFLRGNDNIVLSKSTFRQAGGYAVWIGGCPASSPCHPDDHPDEPHYDHAYRFENNTFERSQNTALYLVNAEDVAVKSNTVNTVLAGDGIVADGDNTKPGFTIENNTVKFVTGQTSDGNPTDGIKVRAPSEGVVIRRNTVKTVSGTGIYLIDSGDDERLRHKRAQIIDNTVTDTVRVNRGNNDPQCQGSGWPSALNVAHTDDVLVHLNRVYKNYGEGLTLNTVTLGTVTRNNVHDNFGVNYYLDNAADITLDRNIAVNDPKLTAYYRCNAPAGGVSMANEVGQIPNRITLRNIRITNNILAHSRFGINFFWTSSPHYHPDSWLENTQILNNTIYRTARNSVSVTDRPEHNNNIIESNIWVQGLSADPVANIPKNGFTCLANLWLAATSWDTCASSRDVFEDPLFVDESANDFRLGKGSPAIDAAAYSVIMPSIWHDYFGTKRALSPWDIGAHEYRP